MIAIVSRYRVWIAIGIVLCLGNLEASAQLAIEAFNGPRSAAATATMQRLQPILLRHGITAAPPQVKTMLRAVARPGVIDSKITYALLVERLDRTAKLFLQSGPEKLPAVRRELESVIADVHANPAIMAIGEGSGAIMTRAYAILALCRFKQQDKEGATAALAEQTRSFPELPVADFGPEVARLSREVRAAAARSEPGELAIDVNQRDAQIYVNELARGQNGHFAGKLAAGTYRVLVRVGDKSLAYDVEVVSGKPTKLDLDWSLELALTVSDEWIGVTLPKDAIASGELASAIALARKTEGISTISMIHITEVQNRPQVTIALYEYLSPERSSTTAKLSRRGRITLAGDVRDDERLEALAAFVSKGVPSRDVEDLTDPRGHVAAKQAAGASRQPSTAGRKRRLTPYILVIGGGAAMLAGGVAYALDEDEFGRGTMDPSYRDTAPYAIAIGAAGIVSIGIGTWLWLRDSESTPTVAVGQSGAVFGWAGTF